MSDADLNTATTYDLLVRFSRERESARRYADWGWANHSTVARENAEAIAAEIERRCVR